MLKRILSEKILHSLDFLDVSKLVEIRIRTGYPIVIEYGGRFYLGENGIADNKNDALILNEREVGDIVFKACECSIYAHNEELKQGFITLSNGVRIGLCGEIVWDKNEIKTIKNFSSINIRFPHIVENCSLKILPYLYDEQGIYNTLVIAPPACGKTTMIRDIARQMSDKFIARNVLIVDERNEICAVNSGRQTLYAGSFVDIFSRASKGFAIVNGIRVMSPDLIILDEIASKEDIEALLNVVGAGVKFITTTHSQNLDDLSNKIIFSELLKMKVIDRFVVLSNKNGIGTIEGVWGNDKMCLFCGG